MFGKRSKAEERLSALERRLEATENKTHSLVEANLAERYAQLEAGLKKITGEDGLSTAAVDSALRKLGARTDDLQRPTGDYLNTRFRGLEWAMLNVKQLGYELAKALAETRMHEAPPHPPQTKLKTSLCTQADMETDWVAYWLAEAKFHRFYHRKLWEVGYGCQAIWEHGKMAPGNRGIGFGCGSDVVPSICVKHGVDYVLATDLDPERDEAKAWGQTGQLATAVEPLRMRHLCEDETKLQRIDYRPVDMNDIPRDLDGQFDFCWSLCALEHIGTIEKGLAFIENSLRTLKPGGVAVHTTEYNLEVGPETMDNWPCVFFQKKHWLGLVDRLQSQGHQVAEIDLDPGSQILDGWIDIPPWEHTYLKFPHQFAHLKLSGDGFPVTSVGIIVTKGG